MRSSRCAVLENGFGAGMIPKCGLHVGLLKIALCCIVLAMVVSLSLLVGGTCWTSEYLLLVGENETDATLKDLLRPGYVIENPDLCTDNGKSLRVLVLVTSAPDHVEQRAAIRYTWGHFTARRDVAIGFFLGATDDADVQASLRDESQIYGDVVQTTNVDRYRTLTVKTASLLRWVDLHCARAPFVLKTDDDMFVNVLELLDFTRLHAGVANTIFGNVAVGTRPVRNRCSKYRLSEKQFSSSTLPEFASGPAYLMTKDVVRRLYLGALDRRPVPLEDVFFTGVVARDLGISRVHSDKFHYSGWMFACDKQKSISLHDVSYEKQFFLWSKVMGDKKRCR